MGNRGNNAMLQSTVKHPMKQTTRKKFSLQKNSDSEDYIVYDFIYRKSIIRQEFPW